MLRMAAAPKPARTPMSSCSSPDTTWCSFQVTKSTPTSLSARRRGWSSTLAWPKRRRSFRAFFGASSSSWICIGVPASRNFAITGLLFGSISTSLEAVPVVTANSRLSPPESRYTATADALGIVQQDRLIALDRQSPERSCHWALFGLHLLAAVVEVAERERAALGDSDRDVERIDVDGLPDLLEDLAEDFHRVERASDGMADLDERGKETRATLRGEARSDVEVAEEEEGDAGDEEPRLDEDDLHGDDRGKAPQELSAHRAVHPLTRDLVEVHVPQRTLQQHDLRDADEDQHQHRCAARDDRRRDGLDHQAELRAEDRVQGGGRTGGDRDRCRVADHLERPLAREDVVGEACRRGHARDGARRHQHDAGDHRYVRCRQLGVALNADGPDRKDERGKEEEAQVLRRNASVERVAHPERHVRRCGDDGDRDQ